MPVDAMYCNWLPKRGYYSIRKSCSTSTNSNFLNLYSAVGILTCYSYKCAISSISHLSPSFLSDFKIPNTARLKFINEPMHRQILPSPGTRFAHRLRIGDVVHMHAHVLLDDPHENFRMRRAADEAPGELDDWRTPTLEDSPDLWRPVGHDPKLFLHRHSLCGRLRRLSAPDQLEASWELTHCARYSGYAQRRMGVPRAPYVGWGGSDCTYIKSYIGSHERGVNLLGDVALDEDVAWG